MTKRCEAKHYGPGRETLADCEHEAVYNFEGLAICAECAGEAAEGGEAMLGVNLRLLTDAPIKTPEEKPVRR